MKVVETYLRGLGLSPKNTAATHPYDFVDGTPTLYA